MNVRFICHDIHGAEKNSNILERLRLGNRGIQMASRMVRHHLRPTQMSSGTGVWSGWRRSGGVALRPSSLRIVLMFSPRPPTRARPAPPPPPPPPPCLLNALVSYPLSQPPRRLPDTLNFAGLFPDIRAPTSLKKTSKHPKSIKNMKLNVYYFSLKKHWFKTVVIHYFLSFDQRFLPSG